MNVGLCQRANRQADNAEQACQKDLAAGFKYSIHALFQIDIFLFFSTILLAESTGAYFTTLAKLRENAYNIALPGTTRRRRPGRIFRAGKQVVTA